VARNVLRAGRIEERNGVNEIHTAGARTSAWRANASLALAGCLWGTGFLFGKIAFREMSVSENVSYRFLFGCAPLLPIAFRRRSFFRVASRRDGWLALAAIVIGFPVQFLIQFKGLQLTTVSHASLIVGTLPVMVALASVPFLHERPGAVEWLLLLLSALGALLIALSSGNARLAAGPTLAGDFLVLLSMVASTGYILLSKRLLHRYDPLEITAWMILIGTLLIFLCVEPVYAIRFRFSPEIWGAAAGQGLLATTGAYLFWNWGLARIPASRAGVFLNLEPLLGACLGVVVLHETLGMTAMLGAALILGPAVYFSRKT
jgi:drug/metabolite transporter (DMT)-like permease